MEIVNIDKQPGNSQGRGKGKPFRKGQSGNPKGRPKKELCLTEALREELQNVSPADASGQNRTWMQLIVEATMRLAIKGNSAALKEVWERVDGKVKDNVNVEGGIKVIRLPAPIEDDEEWAAQCRAEYERRSSMGSSAGAADMAGKIEN